MSNDGFRITMTAAITAVTFHRPRQLHESKLAAHSITAAGKDDFTFGR